MVEMICINKYVKLENQDPELQLLSCVGCVHDTSFKKISFSKWKQIVLIVAFMLHET